MTTQKKYKLETYTAIVYALQALNVFLGVTIFAGIIMNYLKRKETKEEWLESHFTWQIVTFWYSVIFWTAMLCIMVILGLGSFDFNFNIIFPLLLQIGSLGSISGFLLGGSIIAILSGAWFIWYLYRFIKGAVYLFDEKPI